MEKGRRDEWDFRHQFVAQAASLSRRIYKEHGVDRDDLETLKTIYLVEMGKISAVSRISPVQKELLDRLGIALDG